MKIEKTRLRLIQNLFRECSVTTVGWVGADMQQVLWAQSVVLFATKSQTSLSHACVNLTFVQVNRKVTKLPVRSLLLHMDVGTITGWDELLVSVGTWTGIHESFEERQFGCVVVVEQVAENSASAVTNWGSWPCCGSDPAASECDQPFIRDVGDNRNSYSIRCKRFEVACSLFSVIWRMYFEISDPVVGTNCYQVAQPLLTKKGRTCYITASDRHRLVIEVNLKRAQRIVDANSRKLVALVRYLRLRGSIETSRFTWQRRQGWRCVGLMSERMIRHERQVAGAMFAVFVALRRTLMPLTHAKSVYKVAAMSIFSDTENPTLLTCDPHMSNKTQKASLWLVEPQEGKTPAPRFAKFFRSFPSTEPILLSRFCLLCWFVKGSWHVCSRKVGDGCWFGREIDRRAWVGTRVKAFWKAFAHCYGWQCVRCVCASSSCLPVTRALQ